MTHSTEAFNPRFVAYSSANGNTPENQLIIDKEKYKGGSMCGFMLYIQTAKTKAAELDLHFIKSDYIIDDEDFTDWLLNQYTDVQS